MAVQAGKAVDLVKEVPRDIALVQRVLETVCLEVEVPFHWDLEGSDQGVKVD